MKLTKKAKALMDQRIPVRDGDPPRKGEYAIVPRWAASLTDPLRHGVFFLFSNDRAAANAVTEMNRRVSTKYNAGDRCAVAMVKVVK